MIRFPLAGACVFTPTTSTIPCWIPESRTNVTLWDLTLRQTLVPGFRVKVLLRSSRGDETLTLTDSTGALPTRRLDIQRSGLFGAGLSKVLGGPEVAIGLGAEIALPFGR